MINKVWCKIAGWFSYIFINFFWHSIRFLQFNPSSPIMFMLWNIPKEKYFSPLRTLNLFIKSFVNPFVDIALTFFDSLFILFYVTSFSLLPKSVIFTKLAMSLLLAKFARNKLKSRVSVVNSSTSGAVIYLSRLWSVIFLSI